MGRTGGWTLAVWAGVAVLAWLAHDGWWLWWYSAGFVLGGVFAYMYADVARPSQPADRALPASQPYRGGGPELPARPRP